MLISNKCYSNTLFFRMAIQPKFPKKDYRTEEKQYIRETRRKGDSNRKYFRCKDRLCF